MSILCLFCHSIAPTERPYIKLIPLRYSKTDEDVVNINITEGESIDLAVQIKAYPEIQEPWWDTPTLTNATNQNIFSRKTGNG